MNIARADDGLWHLADNTNGVYVRIGHHAEGITLSHEEAWKFLAGLTGVMGNAPE